MPGVHSYHHIRDLKAQLALEHQLGVAEEHRIPLSKILHALGRKGYLKTVIWERGAHNHEYECECRFYSLPYTGVDRLHFYGQAVKKDKPIPAGAKYGGYCDLRPDTRSVISAHISQYSVIRKTAETYAYLCCAVDHRGPSNKASTNGLTVRTFPFAEKDRQAVMCSQAALLCLISYWNSLRPGMFSATDAIALNRAAGVPDEAILQSQKGRGLTGQEIRGLLGQQAVDFLPIAYDKKNPHWKRQCIQDIYGFVESGFPVLLAIKLPRNSYHALLVLGHTHDRNSWTAIADLGYFRSRRAVERTKYLPNTAWISNFIVHDDNFGPYYFMPTEKLVEVFEYGFVVLPDRAIGCFPTGAANTAFDFVTRSEFTVAVRALLKKDAISPANQQWFREFVKHLSVDAGDGLVLRPMLLSGRGAIKRYEKHALYPAVKTLMSDRLDRYSWYVEMSWPDLYCHRQLCSGAVLMDPETLNPFLIHLPGLAGVMHEGQLEVFALENEDVPRSLHGAAPLGP